MNKTLVALMLLGSIGLSTPSFAAETSLHEVYQAANAGKLDEAQHMMHGVLQAHPNSGKAHYVEAELLAKQGQLKQAAGELATAEKFSPGLPFAKAEAVSALKGVINPVQTNHQAAPQHFAAAQPAMQPAAESHFPTGLLFMGLALIAFIAWAVKFMGQRATAPAGGGAPLGSGYRSAYPASPYGGQAPAAGMPGMPGGMAPASGPGFGSRMVGGLATGAAVGAGVVAGEALMHHFMDGPKAAPLADQNNFASFDSIPTLPSTPLNEMGGDDFGIADSSSWDDSSSSDWN